jgi:hypothetical protein
MTKQTAPGDGAPHLPGFTRPPHREHPGPHASTALRVPGTYDYLRYSLERLILEYQGAGGRGAAGIGTRDTLPCRGNPPHERPRPAAGSGPAPSTTETVCQSPACSIPARQSGSTASPPGDRGRRHLPGVLDQAGPPCGGGGSAMSRSGASGWTPRARSRHGDRSGGDT